MLATDHTLTLLYSLSLLASLGLTHHTTFESSLSLTGSTSEFNIRNDPAFSHKCPSVVTLPSCHCLDTVTACLYGLCNSLNSQETYNWFSGSCNRKSQFLSFTAAVFKFISVVFCHELQQPWICQLRARGRLSSFSSHGPGGAVC